MPEPPNPPRPQRQRSTRGRLMKKAADNPHAGRSDVYRWLRQEYASVTEALAAHDPSWETIAGTMIAEGVRGRHGSLPNAKSIPKVWARVCRDIDAGQARKARKPMATVKAPVPAPTPVSAAKPPPLSDDRSPGPLSRFARKADPLPATDPALIVNNVDCTPQEALAGLRRILDHRSGR